MCHYFIYPAALYRSNNHFKMPASGKILANKAKKANIAAGIGDEQGRLPSRVKAPEVNFNCTQCQTPIRMTKKNVDAKVHFESKHPTSTFAVCFPGFFDPTVCTASASVEGAEEGASGGGSKLDIDLIKKQAREAKTVAEGGMTDAQKAAAKSVKKKEDLSFLDDALAATPGKKKK
jgi:hypothetical protein